jgi:hypothetical protein
VGGAGAERDDLVVIPNTGSGKERSDVNSLSHLYVAAHLDEMLDRAAMERLARKPAAKRPNRIGAAAKSVWSFLSGPAERPMTLPTLTNYPYRG